jgi:hypothetical protein
MNGKISIILVLGFSALFALFGRNMLSSSSVTVDNFSFYFNRTQANQIARSGVYIGLANLNILNTGFTGATYNLAGGTAVVSLQVSGTNGARIITSIGSYGSGENTVTDTIVTTLRQRSYSEYGNYYNMFSIPKTPPAVGFDNIWAATGDVFDGKFHANDLIRCYGNPEFKGEVTTSKGILPYDKYSNPIFHEGYKVTTAEIPTIDMSVISGASSGGKMFYDTTGANRFTDVYLKFYADGTVDYKSKIGLGAWSTVKNVSVSSLTSNGLIYIQGGKVSVEGVLNGQVTVVATKNGLTSTDAGSVWIPNSITYATDPNLDYGKHAPPFSCDDVLGLVAEKEVMVTYNNARGDINIHASIFAQNGGLKIQDYKSYSTAHNMNLVGGIIGNYVEPTAKYSSTPPYPATNGYRYIHKYDSRFDVWTPPYFPKRRLFVPELWYTGNVKIPVWG